MVSLHWHTIKGAIFSPLATAYMVIEVLILSCMFSYTQATMVNLKHIKYTISLDGAIVIFLFPTIGASQVTRYHCLN